MELTEGNNEADETKPFAFLVLSRATFVIFYCEAIRLNLETLIAE
jgi:hypothetical protein